MKNKYKVEITQTNTYIMDIYADNEDQARELAPEYFEEVKTGNIEHYYQTGDTLEEITNLYDVTNTEDPFDPENDPENN